jgi:sugar O-acyltransferase (sialic acid O-acetyltransferase NeuD family)
MSAKLVIWGAGGHGKVVFDVIRSSGYLHPIVFLDEDPNKTGSTLCDCNIIGSLDEIAGPASIKFIIAIGENRLRARCFSRALHHGLCPTSAIHASAVISPSATIGPGTVIMPGAIVNSGSIIKENSIINTGAVVEHDCMIDAHTHISPRVALGGGVRVGALAHVGIGAVVLPRATVGEHAVVGAGAVVLKEAPAYSVVVGVPAKVLSTYPHHKST